jgi:predicted transcriptional regulator
VDFDGLQKIMGTGGLVAASGMRAESDLEHRAEKSLVEANQYAND